MLASSTLTRADARCQDRFMSSTDPAGDEPHLFIPLARETVDAIEGSDDPITRIRSVAWMRQWVEDVLREFVEDARRCGHGWDAIATALGVTRQAAWQRYRTAEEEDRRAMTGGNFLRADEIWAILVRRMVPMRWYDLREIYALVATDARISDADLEPDAPGSNSPRWQRNIRNVLQRRKSGGEVAWDGRARYRLS